MVGPTMVNHGSTMVQPWLTMRNLLQLELTIADYLGETLTMVSWLTMVNHGWTMVDYG